MKRIHKEDEMEIEDLIQRRRHNKHGYHNHDKYGHRLPSGKLGNSHNKYYDGGHHHGHHKIQMFLTFIKSVSGKKTLLIGLVLIAVIILIAGVLFLMAVIPLIMSITYLETNGLKGIYDAVLPHIDKLWRGNG